MKSNPYLTAHRESLIIFFSVARVGQTGNYKRKSNAKQKWNNLGAALSETHTLYVMSHNAMLKF